MKVLLISPKEGIVGGIAVWTSHILDALSRKEGLQVELCDFSRTVTGQMIDNPVRKIVSAIKDYSRLTRMASGRIKDFDGQVVHICTPASTLLIKDLILVRRAHRKGVKTCVHFHFGRIPELAKAKNWEWKLLRRLVKESDMSVVMDKASYDCLLHEGIKNVSILANPLSDKVLDIVDNIHVEREEGLVLFAGHCIPTKGVRELVRACKLIPGVKLRMVGAISPQMKEELLLEAGESAGRLEIMGQIPYEKTLEQMLRCEIFALPTYTEGFPNVILESMACSCAIVASSVGAIPQMLEEQDGESFGKVIPAKDENALKQALESFLNDKALAKECGKNARKRVVERYKLDKIAEGLHDIWQTI
ncbi:MAG: glycosyltransferase family 4 protein [Bacteroidales bacterium]|nr:glycosyltransferase family 4 protein [Bacteroidales bacterium]